MKRSLTFDVIIVGRGITGVSAAWHLSQLGYRNILLMGPDRTPDQCASIGPGFATPSTIDNITRIAHGHGNDLAGRLLKLGHSGHQNLKQFAESQNIPWVNGNVFRFAPTEHEKSEMQVAIEIYNQLGYAASLTQSHSTEHPRSAKAIQQDGLPSSSTDSKRLLAALEIKSDIEIQSTTVNQIVADKNNVQLTTENGTFAAEMVIVAAHLNTGKLVANLQDSLVSFADQWISFDASASVVPLNAGDFWIGHHGHYAVWRSHDQKVYMSGARFLRHWAGIEAKTADVRDDITAHLLKKGEEWFGFTGISNIEARAILDCRPCDELPIIGPMFGQNRILVGAGYMGSGLALGFAAGSALADIVHKGAASQLHTGLTPARLRSLAN